MTAVSLAYFWSFYDYRTGRILESHKNAQTETGEQANSTHRYVAQVPTARAFARDFIYPFFGNARFQYGRDTEHCVCTMKMTVLGIFCCRCDCSYSCFKNVIILTKTQRHSCTNAWTDGRTDIHLECFIVVCICSVLEFLVLIPPMMLLMLIL